MFLISGKVYKVKKISSINVALYFGGDDALIHGPKFTDISRSKNIVTYRLKDPWGKHLNTPEKYTR